MAFAISIALHEIAAGAVPRSPSETASQTEIVTSARILRVSMRPTPAPSPAPVPIALRPAIIAPRSARIVTRTTEGRAGASASMPNPQPPRLRESPFATSRPVWDVASGHAISGAQISGSGTDVGTGSGSGSQGNGSGGAPADEPCGYVTFSDPHGSQFDSRTRGFWVDIRMSVHFSDGSMQTTILDYPWYYPSEAANPWSDQNVKDPDFPTRFQAPPPEKLAEEPALVKYVAKHSTPDGMTMLRDCPEPSPTPAS